MSNKERLRITELDFDGIKNNLKTFLKNQTEFFFPESFQNVLQQFNKLFSYVIKCHKNLH